MRSLLVMLALLVAAPAPAQDEALFNADGYRIAHYRAPVPTAPECVTRITAREASALRPDRDAIFIDVLPAEGGHREPGGRWRLAVPRASIPGAHWFPEAGRGEPDAVIAAAFEKGVAHLVRRHPHQPLIVFCLSDCWMSWNAARRLHALGHPDVRWLAEGSDGWRDLGLPLQDTVPVGGLARP